MLHMAVAIFIQFKKTKMEKVNVRAEDFGYTEGTQFFVEDNTLYAIMEGWETPDFVAKLKRVPVGTLTCGGGWANGHAPSDPKIDWSEMTDQEYLEYATKGSDSIGVHNGYLIGEVA